MSESYARLYYRFAQEFPAIYRDNNALATWVRLLVLADASWPLRPPLPGIPMRSRLEARYAAYLDSNPDTTWEYEPRAFADPHGQYLPDFRVQHAGWPHFYVEVKPTIETALAVLERVQIILSSEPSAILMVAVPDCHGQFIRYAGRDQWIWVD